MVFVEALTIEPAGEVAAERPPDVLTVPEAGRILRLGKSAAYEQAQRWIQTDGEYGIPAMRIGRAVRVPRVMLEEYLGGPISWPPPSTVTDIDEKRSDEEVSDSGQVVEIDLTDRQASRKRRTAAAKQAKAARTNDDEQSRLPFTA